MCNGEIYNHLELREKYGLKIDSKSDCAVILPLFRALNENIEALNNVLLGEYAMFVTKENIKTGDIEYYLSIDPLSVRPAFYFTNDSQFGCSSLLCGLCGFTKDVKRLDQGTFIHGRFHAGSGVN